MDSVHNYKASKLESAKLKKMRLVKYGKSIGMELRKDKGCWLCSGCSTSNLYHGEVCLSEVKNMPR